MARSRLPVKKKKKTKATATTLERPVFQSYCDACSRHYMHTYTYTKLYAYPCRRKAHAVCEQAGLPPAWHLTTVAALLTGKYLDGVEIFAGCKQLTIR